jgi:hypothetical protein
MFRALAGLGGSGRSRRDLPFAQMSGRVAAVSGRATFEHGPVTRLAGAAGRTRGNRLPPAGSTEPAWEAERPAPGSLAWPRDLGFTR